MFRFIIRAAATVAALAVALVVLAVAPANAQVRQVDGESRVIWHHDTVTYHAHVPGTNWTYIELRDGSEWLATPCRTEDSTNCWWNARTRGNGAGRSFLADHGHRHYTARR